MKSNLAELFERNEIDDAVDVAFDALKQADNNISQLPRSLQTVLRVNAAQGILDDGDLQHFFESNFEGTPRYSVFIDAYATIGATDAADLLEQAVALFDIPNAHLDATARQEIMESLWKDSAGRFAGIDLVLCGNRNVWECLREFVKAHSEDFGL